MKRSINTKIWDDPWFESIPTEQKLFWVYLLTNRNTNMLGVYELSLRKMAFETGLIESTLSKAFEAFASVKKAKYIDGYVVIFNFLKNQKFNPNMKKSAVNEYINLPNRLKMSIGPVFEHNLSQAFGSLWKGLQTVPNIEVEVELEREVELESEKESILSKKVDVNKDDKEYYQFITNVLKEKPKSIELILMKNKIDLAKKDDLWNDFIKNVAIYTTVINDKDHAYNTFRLFVEKNNSKYQINGSSKFTGF